MLGKRRPKDIISTNDILLVLDGAIEVIEASGHVELADAAELVFEHLIETDLSHYGEEEKKWQKSST